MHIFTVSVKTIFFIIEILLKIYSNVTPSKCVFIYIYFQLSKYTYIPTNNWSNIIIISTNMKNIDFAIYIYVMLMGKNLKREYDKNICIIENSYV